MLPVFTEDFAMTFSPTQSIGVSFLNSWALSHTPPNILAASCGEFNPKRD